jgi:AcrR family transcriptional regulator
VSIKRPSAPRRSAKSRQAILDAAIAVTRERGYADLSIEAIAARAGVGKQTIYRWWPSKGAVVLEAFLELTQPQLEWAEGEDLVDELRAQVARVLALLRDPGFAPHLKGLAAEVQLDAGLADEFRDRVALPYREMTLARLERAQQAGELRGDVDLTLLADALFAPMWFRLLVGPGPLDSFDPHRHVRQLMDGAKPL